jgi:hypothetical protein
MASAEVELGRFIELCALLACATGCGAPQASAAADAIDPTDAAVPAPRLVERVRQVDPEDRFGDDFADPFVLPDEDAFFAFATGAGRLHLQVARSLDLKDWSLLGDPLPELPAWASKAPGLTWAPSALARRDGYVLYYTARDAASGFQCISRARSSHVEGPYFDDSSRPLVCQVAGDAPFCGSIDPSPFVDFDGKPYLLWKSDENSARCRTAPRIWAQQLSDDGLSLVGSAQTLLAMDQRWEGAVIEGPSMVRRGGRYFLFYSGNDYDSADYAIGYARCPSVLELCTKVSTIAPYVRSAGSIGGPGGQEVFHDAQGGAWMAYHAWTSPKTSYGAGGARSLRLARLVFADDGDPGPMSER